MNTHEYSYRTFKEEDGPTIVALLNKAFGFSKEFWVWKHTLCPNFDPSLIAVVENDGKVIGCTHWIPRDLKISSSLTVKAALGGDTVVHPQHRGHGVGIKLFRFTNVLLKNKGIVAVYGFATPEIAKHFYGAVGSIPVRLSTTVYMRLLNCRRLKEIVSSINRIIKMKDDLHARLEKLDLRALFVLKGAPPFIIETDHGKISLEETRLENPNIVIKADLGLLTSFIEGEKKIFNLVKAFLTRKLIINGSLRDILKLYRIFKIVKKAYNIA